MPDDVFFLDIGAMDLPDFAMDIDDPPPPVEWTPDLMLEARAFWRVNDLTGKNPGDLIDSLPSAGGVIANTLTQTTEALQPVVGTRYDRKTALFDGLTQYMLADDNTASNGAEALYFWCLVEFPTAFISTDNQLKFLMYDENGAGSGRRFGLILSNAVVNKKIGVTVKVPDNATTLSRFSPVNMPIGTPHLLFAQIIAGGEGGPKIEVRMDGVVILSEVPGVGGVPAFGAAAFDSTNSLRSAVGGLYGSATAQANAHFFMMGKGRGVPPLSDIEKLEGHTLHFIGKGDQLPPSHPYFSAPPFLEE